MTESNPVQVTLSDDGIRINAVTDQAKSTDQDVKNLYAPNMMSVIEKQGTTARFAGETSRYNVMLESAKAAGIDTKAFEASYATLNDFMGTVIGEGDKASDVDREKYSQALNEFNNQMAQMQNALSNDYDNKMAANSAAVSDAAVAVASADTRIKEGETAASQALSESNVSVEKADEAASAVKVVSQDVTTLKGGSTATLAQLETGIQSKVNSSDYNSKITQLDNQIQSVVVNRSNLVPYSGYWTSLVGWTLEAWGDPAGTLTLVHHSFYHNAKDNTLCVGTAATNGKSAYSERFPVKPNTTYTVSFSGFASGNVKGSAVYFLGRSYTSSNDYDTNGIHNIVNNLIMSPSGINRYHGTFTTSSTETEGYIRLDNVGSNNGLSSSSYFAEIKMEEGATATSYERDGASSEIVQLSDDINLRVKKDDVINQVNLSPEGVLIGGEHVSITGKTHIDNGSIDTAAIKDLTADKITAGTIKANVKMSALEISGESVTGGNVTASVFSTPNKTFTVDKDGNITASSLYLIGNKNFVYNSELLGNAAGWSLGPGGYLTGTTAHDGTLSVAINNTSQTSTWHAAAYSKPMVPQYSSTATQFSISGWIFIRSLGATSAVGMSLEFLDSAGTRIGVLDAFADLSITGKWQQVHESGIVIPTGTATIRVRYQFNGTGGTICWSQPMISNSPMWQGYTADTGNVLYAGQVMLDRDGKLTTTYDGVTQDNEKYYRAWKLLNGTLSIGRGYITSSASGQRNISGVNEATTNVQGTLTAGYLKLTGSGMRTYADAGTVTISSGSTDYVVVDVHGITLRNGAFISGTLEGDVHGTVYGSLSGSVSGSVNAASGGIQAKAVLVGYSQHTINTTDGEPLTFQKDHGNSGTYIPIKASAFTVTSKASTKKDIRPYEDNGNVVANTNLATYLYKGETYSENAHMGPILDDTMGDKQYYTRQEITLLDGSGIDTTKAGFYGWSAIKALQRENEQMQIRLRKLEITEETNNG